MSDDRGDEVAAIRDRIDRLRRANAALAGTPPEPDDAVAALTDCIRTEDRAGARSLALAWMEAAAGREQAAVALLAGALGVPAGYFTDDGTSRRVNEDMALAADASRRGVATTGPCRTGATGPGLAAVAARLVRELERDRPPG